MDILSLEDSPDYSIKKPSYLLLQDRWKKAIIYTPFEQIDGHWLVKVTHMDMDENPQKEFEVIGVTSHKRNIPNKTYEKAVEYAQNLAKKDNLEFEDRTSKNKSKLEQLSNPGRGQKPSHQRTTSKY